jgi:hypothetical protein
MSFDLKEGYGGLFRIPDDKKVKDGPDYRGDVNVGGTLYEIAGWLKQGQKGKWLSLKVQLPRDKTSGKGNMPAAKRNPDANEIPF